MSRHQFHSNVGSFLEKQGLDIDHDLSLTYDRVHKNNRDALVLNCWMVFVKNKNGMAFWANSNLVMGHVAGLQHLRTEDMLAPIDPRNAPFEGGHRPGDISIKMRSQQTPMTTYQKIIETALTGGNHARVVVVVVDPYNASPAQAIFNIQKNGIASSSTPGRSLTAPAEETKMDVRGLIFATSTTALNLGNFALKQTVFKSWFNREFVIPGHSRPPMQPWTEEFRSSVPEMEVASLSGEGKFMVPESILRPFIDSDATALEAHTMLGNLIRDAEAADAPRWTLVKKGDVSTPPVLGEVADVPSVMPVTDGIASVADVVKKGLLCDTQMPNGKVRILVTKENRGYAHILTDITVSRGEKFLLMGSGGRKDAEEASKLSATVASFPVDINNDATEVWFSQNGSESLVTIYSLMAQLTLQGHRSVNLSYHVMEPATGGSSNRIDRYTIKQVRPKWWCAKRVRNEPGSDAQKIDWTNVGAFLNYAEIPNHYCKATHAHVANIMYMRVV